MTAAIDAHNDMLRLLGQQIRETIPECTVLPLGAGGCKICEKCTYPDEPCLFPDQAIASVEGYGMDVRALVESVGLKYINGQNTVSYVGMVLFR